MALRQVIQDTGKISSKTATFILYRTILKELPRVLVLYDVDMPLMTAKNAITFHFRKYANVEDERYSISYYFVVSFILICIIHSI